MSNFLMTIDWEGKQPPSVEQVAAKLNIAATAIDEKYGFVMIDPDTKTYAFMVDENALGKISDNKKNIKGPFSNPRIEPFNLEE